MRYNPLKHNRRSIRLKNYDYSKGGLYFITLVCQDRIPFFGHIKDGKTHLNEAGRMIEEQYLELKKRFPNIKLHEYIIMPDHFHSIIEMLPPPHEQASCLPPNNSEENIKRLKRRPKGADSTKPLRLGDIIGAFKSITTVEYIKGVKAHNWKTFRKRLWLRNYYEHIIRNERAYRNITNYIINNPKKWEEDKLSKNHNQAKGK